MNHLLDDSYEMASPVYSEKVQLKLKRSTAADVISANLIVKIK